MRVKRCAAYALRQRSPPKNASVRVCVGMRTRRVSVANHTRTKAECKNESRRKIMICESVNVNKKISDFKIMWLIFIACDEQNCSLWITYKRRQQHKNPKYEYTARSQPLTELNKKIPFKITSAKKSCRKYRLLQF